MTVERVGGADALMGAGVTAREAEVLSAVAQRLRNSEIAEQLFISVGQTLRDALQAAARDMRALLVVDNCEHVVAEAADQIHRLLALAPGMHVLAASRPWVRGASARVEALMCDRDAAEEWSAAALDLLADAPFERARALLELGARRRRESRPEDGPRFARRCGCSRGCRPGPGPSATSAASMPSWACARAWT